MLGGMLRARPMVCVPCAAGSAPPRSSNSVIMSWSSWTRLWQCITYLPSTARLQVDLERGPEVHQQLDALVGADIDDVLQARLVWDAAFPLRLTTFKSTR
jgi:hypothetical protein